MLQRKSELGRFWEDIRGEFLGSTHASFDLHLAPADKYIILMLVFLPSVQKKTSGLSTCSA
jgi:hypothetical protein